MHAILKTDMHAHANTRVIRPSCAMHTNLYAHTHTNIHVYGQVLNLEEDSVNSRVVNGTLWKQMQDWYKSGALMLVVFR